MYDSKLKYLETRGTLSIYFAYLIEFLTDIYQLRYIEVFLRHIKYF